MIKKLQLEYFKGFEDTQQLDLKPLTILSGVNSCGKSTIIQSILMLKQTFERQSLYRTTLLNGQYVHLGSFEDVIHNKESNNIVKIKFEVNPFKNVRKPPNGMDPRTYLRPSLRDINFGDRRIQRDGNRERILEIEFGLKLPEKSKKSPIVENYTIKAKTKFEDSTEFDEGLIIKFKRKEKDNYIIQWKNTILPPFYGYKKIPIPSNIKEYFCPVCKHKHYSYSENGKKHYSKYYAFEGSFERKVSFFNMIPEIILNSEKDENEPSIHILRPIRLIREILQNIFENINYIGPLREEPSRRYIYEEEYFDIGNRGENAPFILAIEGDKKIHPYYFFNSTLEKWEKVVGDSLKAGVIKWLNYMEISNTYDLKSQEEILRLYLPTKSDKEVNVTLADVGFGVSQILPILVEGLRIKPNQMLILEQPEIHLHPKLQMQLADFFISMILSGRKILIETHSDHIINRIVRRIIENKENKIISKTNILFFEVGDKGSVPIKVKIDSDLGIVNWPKGFFDQSADEKKIIIQKGIQRRNELK